MNMYLISTIFVFSFFSTSFSFENGILYHTFMDYKKAKRVVENIEHTELQELPEIIRNKNKLVRFPYNTVVLYGEPGVGKTTIMNAVATLVGTEWGVTFISDKSLKAEPGKRGATMAAFCKVLETATQEHENNLILINELHIFLNHFNSVNHDTDLFSTAFQATLDECLDKNNMFFIASVNEFNKVAQPIKDRLESSMFEITGFGNQQAANTEFFEQIDSRNYVLSEDDREYLRIRFEEMKAKPRETKNFADRICLKSYSMRDRKIGVVAITREAIDHIIAQRIKSHVYIEINKPVVSDEDRRHEESKELTRESIALTKESIELNKAQYKENKEIHERERRADDIRADYNAFLSSISTKASLSSSERVAPNSEFRPIIGDRSRDILSKGMDHMIIAMEMKEGFERKLATKPAPSACSIQ